jgi:hypothetical protein
MHQITRITPQLAKARTQGQAGGALTLEHLHDEFALGDDHEVLLALGHEGRALSEEVYGADGDDGEVHGFLALEAEGEFYGVGYAEGGEVVL